MRFHKWAVLLLAFCSLHQGLQASDVKASGQVVVDEKVEENLYVAGGEVLINAIIDGDLVAAGGSVIIQDSLMKDVSIFAGEAIIKGVAADDVKIAAGEIIVTKDVFGDLVILGGEVNIKRGVTIWGDLIVTSGEVLCYGNIKGDVKVVGAEFNLYGDVEGDVEILAADVNLKAIINGNTKITANELDVHEGTVFNSDVRYWLNEEESYVDWSKYLASGVKAVEDQDLNVNFPKFEPNFKEIVQKLTIYRSLSGGVLVTLLVLVFGSFFQRKAGQLTTNVKGYFGVGLLLFLVLPIISAISFATIIAAPVGVIGFALFIIILVVANALTAVVMAYEVEKNRISTWTDFTRILVALGFFVAFRLIGLIPVAGPIVTFVAAAIGVGYVLKMIRQKPNNEDNNSTDFEVV